MSVNFTPREREIVDLVSQAYMRKTIASLLKISIHTVDSHLSKIHLKTNTTTMAELMLFITNESKNNR